MPTPKYTKALFVNIKPHGMSVAHLPPGLITVMDAVSKIENADIRLRTCDYEIFSSAWLISIARGDNPQIISIPLFSDGHTRIEEIIKTSAYSLPNVIFVVGGPHVESGVQSILSDCGNVLLCRCASIDNIQETYVSAFSKATGTLPNVNRIDSDYFTTRPINYDILYNSEQSEWKYSRPVLISSFGCNHRCSFCFESVRSNKLTFRSIDAFKHELFWFASNLEFPYVMIADDNALAYSSHFKKMINTISEVLEKHPDLRFFLLARPEDIIVNSRLISDLSKCHCIRIQIGIESGDLSMRKRYGKYFSNHDVHNAVKILAENDIPTVVGSIIIGGPFENDTSMGHTLELVTELLDIAPGVFEPEFNFLRPYPVIPLMEKYKQGLVQLAGKNIGNTLADKPILGTPDFSEFRLMKWKLQLLNTVRDKIIQLSSRLSLGKLSLLDQFCQRYNLNSLWLEVFQEAANCRTMLSYSRTYGRIFEKNQECEQPSEVILKATIEIFVDWLTSGAKIPFRRNNLIQLSPEEAGFLSLCNGERTYDQTVHDHLLGYPDSSRKTCEDWRLFVQKMIDGYILFSIKL